MTFEEAINYLKNLTKFGMNFGLGRITELMRRLGDPQEKLKVIHVGGTNGKGSTAAMLVEILKDAGFRVGLFTSPHLYSYTERYRINGVEIDKRDVALLIERVRPHLDAMVEEGFEHPTEFEVSTSMAFCYFYDQNVDFVMLEVGLGGEIDSTNVITSPLVSVITNVAMDHMDYLGNTVEEIARVKAGIIKQDRPVVTASADPGVLEVIRETARNLNAPLVHVGEDVKWSRDGEISPPGEKFRVQGRRGDYPDLWIPLLGMHQVENAATAVAVIEVLQDEGYAVDKVSIKNGLRNTRWPARMEIVREKPLVLIDAAHNYEGAKSLRKALDEYFPSFKVILVMGMLGDKERAKVVSELSPRSALAIITKPNSPRASNWQELAQEIRPLVPEVRVVEEINRAVDQAVEFAGPEDLVCITGSIYMVAEAREYLVGDPSPFAQG